MALKFDKNKHAFSLDGGPVPSVTQLLKAAGWIKDGWYNQDAMTRGQHFHYACELLDAGKLDWTSLDNDMILRVEAYEKAKETLGIKIKKSEHIVHRSKLWAGIIDKEALWGGRKTLVELKSGVKEPWHKLQLVAYGATYPKMPRLLLLYCTPQGYKHEELDEDIIDEFKMGWHQMVSQYHWRKKWIK